MVSTEVDGLAAKQRGDELGAAGDEVLAVVQHEQRRLIAELDRELLRGRSAWHLAGAERGQGGATDGVRIGQRRQLDPPHPARVRVRTPRPRPRGPGGSCPRRPNRSASPAARRPAGGVRRRSPLPRPMSGVSWIGRLWRNRSSERSAGNDDGRSGWTTCQMCSGRSEVLEPMVAEVDECGLRRETVGDQRRGRR